MPRRPRPSRTDGLLTPYLLKTWKVTVQRVEAGTFELSTGCEDCDRWNGLEARDDLESLICRGGRRGRRVADAVKQLDERFARATSPTPFATRGSGWWHYRNFD